MSNLQVRLAYGSDGLTCTFPEDRTVVVEPTFVPAAPDPRGLMRSALANPINSKRLRESVEPGMDIAISACDLTRPQPRQMMIEAILEELDGIASPADVTILIATGTHRGNSDEELERMLGHDLLTSCNVVNHDGRDESSLRFVGTMGAGVPVYLNERWLDSDVRITTGFVEPHFFAGFSGGPKMVAPGLAGLETVLTLHDAKRIGHPNAIWGICEGNPVHDDVRAITEGTGVDLAFDVLLNSEKKVTDAFTGDMLAMHKAAREKCKELSMQRVDAYFDVVVTTNSGYPLDQNLYQSIKGMSAAMNVVKEGGLVIAAAECRDGVPDHGSYREFLASAESIGELQQRIESSDETVPDQWQVQVQARVQERARVVVYTDGVSDDQLRAAHFEPCHDIADTVMTELSAVGPHARVCVLPEGPQTIPYLESPSAGD